MNPTAFQRLLDGAGAFLEAADPLTVTLAGCALPVPAEVGTFRRFRAEEGTGYNWVENGTVVIRWSTLRALNVAQPPESGQNIVVRGKTYRIAFTSPDSVGVTLDCVLRA